MDDRMSDHEARIVRLETCYEIMDRRMESLKSDLLQATGRVEKGVDSLEQKVDDLNRRVGTNTGKMEILVPIVIPIITGLLVYYLR